MVTFIDATAPQDISALESKYKKSQNLVLDVQRYLLKNEPISNHYLSVLLQIRDNVPPNRLQNSIKPTLSSVLAYFEHNFPSIKVIPDLPSQQDFSWADLFKRSPEANIINIPESVFAQYTHGSSPCVSLGCGRFIVIADATSGLYRPVRSYIDDSSASRTRAHFVGIPFPHGYHSARS